MVKLITELIEFRGFNDIFIALVEDNNKYFLFLSKYNAPTINIEEDFLSIFGKTGVELYKFLKSYNCQLNVNLNGFNSDTHFNIISLQNKEEYYTIVKVLEIMYGR